MHEKTLSSPEFIAGVLSISATFFQINSARTKNFGFQVKMSSENLAILKLIRDTMHIKNRLITFTEAGTTYVMLNTRSRMTLLNNVIPFMDQYLFGPKLVKYMQWKQSLLNSIK